MKESDIERKIREYALKHGCRCYKLAGVNDVGKPDRILTCNGLTIYMEVKRPGEDASPAQLREHKRIRDAGGIVFIVDSVEAGKRIIDAMLK